MGYIVRMPKLGMEMKQGTLLEWTIAAGDSVEKGDIIGEIESEKTTADIEAREDGVLRQTFIDEGDTVEPGDPIGIVAGPDEDIDAMLEEIDVDEPAPSEPADTPTETEPEPAEGAPDTPAEPTATPTDVTASPRAEKRAADLGVDLTTVEGSGPGGAITTDDVERAAEAAGPTARSVQASPRAEKLAEDLGVDIATVTGTGPGGAITTADVEQAAESGVDVDAPAAETGPAALTVSEERPLDGMRRTIATRLGQSYREAVHVTEHRKADAEGLRAAATAAEETLSVDVSLPDVLLVAISAALDEHPAFNARFEEDVHTLYDEQNIGMAVDIDAGLIAPVIPDIGKKSLPEIATARRRITQRALDEEYTMDDLANGTFTVTNLGVLGVESFNPVINPPQIAILGVNALQNVPVPDDEGGVAFRRHLPLDLSFDHRIVDGADAARFLQTLVDHIEDPWPLLPEEIQASGPDVQTADGPTTEMPGRSVTATLERGMQGVVSAGSFEVPFDEPESVGGSETAPTPVDLFLSALAACMIESIQYQAVEKQSLELHHIEVAASASPAHGPVESLTVHVDIDVDADSATIEKLIDLGKRGCHVSQLVDEGVPFDLSWTSG